MWRKKSLKNWRKKSKKVWKVRNTRNEDNKLEKDMTMDQTILDNWDIAREQHADS